MTGVHERRAGARLVVRALRCARRGPSVPFALLASHETVAAAGGDVAELRDIDDQRPGVRVFVTAKRLTGDPVDTRPAD
jgi:enoyl-CoA hydratase/carnithine racemase